MSISTTGRSSQARGTNFNNSETGISWVAAKNCNCGGQSIAEFRISLSEANPRRPYYKCRACNYWQWAKEEDLVRTTNVAGFRMIWQRMEELEKIIALCMKVAITMAIVLFMVYLKKGIVWFSVD